MSGMQIGAGEPACSGSQQDQRTGAALIVLAAKLTIIIYKPNKIHRTLIALVTLVLRVWPRCWPLWPARTLRKTE